ncbi:hypothetical protein DIPPA_30051 [Diplonema papillatum]|nr:hypothetical protein DIPPA_30051 [Diplonema papillatum]
MVEATAKWKFVSGFMNAGGFTKRESAVVREGFDRVSAGVDVAKTAHAASSGSVWQRARLAARAFEAVKGASASDEARDSMEKIKGDIDDRRRRGSRLARAAAHRLQTATAGFSKSSHPSDAPETGGFRTSSEVDSTPSLPGAREDGLSKGTSVYEEWSCFEKFDSLGSSRSTPVFEKLEPTTPLGVVSIDGGSFEKFFGSDEPAMEATRIIRKSDEPQQKDAGRAADGKPGQGGPSSPPAAAEQWFKAELSDSQSTAGGGGVARPALFARGVQRGVSGEITGFEKLAAGLQGHWHDRSERRASTGKVKRVVPEQLQEVVDDGLNGSGGEVRATGSQEKQAKTSPCPETSSSSFSMLSALSSSGVTGSSLDLPEDIVIQGGMPSSSFRRRPSTDRGDPAEVSPDPDRQNQGQPTQQQHERGLQRQPHHSPEQEQQQQHRQHHQQQQQQQQQQQEQQPRQEQLQPLKNQQQLERQQQEQEQQQQPAHAHHHHHHQQPPQQKSQQEAHPRQGQQLQAAAYLRPDAGDDHAARPFEPEASSGRDDPTRLNDSTLKPPRSPRSPLTMGQRKSLPAVRDRGLPPGQSPFALACLQRSNSGGSSNSSFDKMVIKVSTSAQSTPHSDASEQRQREVPGRVAERLEKAQKVVKHVQDQPLLPKVVQRQQLTHRREARRHRKAREPAALKPSEDPPAMEALSRKTTSGDTTTPVSKRKSDGAIADSSYSTLTSASEPEEEASSEGGGFEGPKRAPNRKKNTGTIVRGKCPVTFVLANHTGESGETTTRYIRVEQPADAAETRANPASTGLHAPRDDPYKLSPQPSTLDASPFPSPGTSTATVPVSVPGSPTSEPRSTTEPGRRRGSKPRTPEASPVAEAVGAVPRLRAFKNVVSRAAEGVAGSSYDALTSPRLRGAKQTASRAAEGLSDQWNAATHSEAPSTSPRGVAQAAARAAEGLGDQRSAEEAPLASPRLRAVKDVVSRAAEGAGDRVSGSPYDALTSPRLRGAKQAASRAAEGLSDQWNATTHPEATLTSPRLRDAKEATTRVVDGLSKHWKATNSQEVAPSKGLTSPRLRGVKQAASRAAEGFGDQWKAANSEAHSAVQSEVLASPRLLSGVASMKGAASRVVEGVSEWKSTSSRDLAHSEGLTSPRLRDAKEATARMAEGLSKQWQTASHEATQSEALLSPRLRGGVAAVEGLVMNSPRLVKEAASRAAEGVSDTTEVLRASAEVGVVRAVHAAAVQQLIDPGAPQASFADLAHDIARETFVEALSRSQQPSRQKHGADSAQESTTASLAERAHGAADDITSLAAKAQGMADHSRGIAKEKLAGVQQVFSRTQQPSTEGPPGETSTSFAEKAQGMAAHSHGIARERLAGVQQAFSRSQQPSTQAPPRPGETTTSFAEKAQGMAAHSHGIARERLAGVQQAFSRSQQPSTQDAPRPGETTMSFAEKVQGMAAHGHGVAREKYTHAVQTVSRIAAEDGEPLGTDQLGIAAYSQGIANKLTGLKQATVKERLTNAKQAFSRKDGTVEDPNNAATSFAENAHEMAAHGQEVARKKLKDAKLALFRRDGTAPENSAAGLAGKAQEMAAQGQEAARERFAEAKKQAFSRAEGAAPSAASGLAGKAAKGQEAARETMRAVSRLAGKPAMPLAAEEGGGPAAAGGQQHDSSAETAEAALTGREKLEQARGKAFGLMKSTFLRAETDAESSDENRGKTVRDVLESAGAAGRQESLLAKPGGARGAEDGGSQKGQALKKWVAKGQALFGMKAVDDASSSECTERMAAAGRRTAHQDIYTGYDDLVDNESPTTSTRRSLRSDSGPITDMDSGSDFHDLPAVVRKGSTANTARKLSLDHLRELLQKQKTDSDDGSRRTSADGPALRSLSATAKNMLQASSSYHTIDSDFCRPHRLAQSRSGSCDTIINNHADTPNTTRQASRQKKDDEFEETASHLAQTAAILGELVQLQRARDESNGDEDYSESREDSDKEVDSAADAEGGRSLDTDSAVASPKAPKPSPARALVTLACGGHAGAPVLPKDPASTPSNDGSSHNSLLEEAVWNSILLGQQSQNLQKTSSDLSTTADPLASVRTVELAPGLSHHEPKSRRFAAEQQVSLQHVAPADVKPHHPDLGSPWAGSSSKRTSQVSEGSSSTFECFATVHRSVEQPAADRAAAFSAMPPIAAFDMAHDANGSLETCVNTGTAKTTPGPSREEDVQWAISAAVSERGSDDKSSGSDGGKGMQKARSRRKSVGGLWGGGAMPATRSVDDLEVSAMTPEVKLHRVGPSNESQASIRSLRSFRRGGAGGASDDEVDLEVSAWSLRKDVTLPHLDDIAEHFEMQRMHHNKAPRGSVSSSLRITDDEFDTDSWTPALSSSKKVDDGYFSTPPWAPQPDAGPLAAGGGLLNTARKHGVFRATETRTGATSSSSEGSGRQRRVAKEPQAHGLGSGLLFSLGDQNTESELADDTTISTMSPPQRSHVLYPAIPILQLQRTASTQSMADDTSEACAFVRRQTTTIDAKGALGVESGEKQEPHAKHDGAFADDSPLAQLSVQRGVVQASPSTVVKFGETVSFFTDRSPPEHSDSVSQSPTPPYSAINTKTNPSDTSPRSQTTPSSLLLTARKQSTTSSPLHPRSPFALAAEHAATCYDDSSSTSTELPHAVSFPQPAPFKMPATRAAGERALAGGRREQKPRRPGGTPRKARTSSSDRPTPASSLPGRSPRLAVNRSGGADSVVEVTAALEKYTAAPDGVIAGLADDVRFMRRSLQRRNDLLFALLKNSCAPNR